MSEQLLGDLHSVVSLKDHQGWKVITRDAEIAHNTAASCWVDVYDANTLQELRVKQLAARNILTLMDQYEARLQEIQMDRLKEENPDLIVPLDVDNNMIDEEGTEEDAE